MGDFTPIETQEQFDAAIGERLKRERETQEKKYSGYVSPDVFSNKSKEYETKIGELNKSITAANEKLAGYDKQIAERDTRLKAYETDSVKTRIAHETGCRGQWDYIFRTGERITVSYDAIKFLQGDNEENIRQSAQALKSLCGNGQAAPLADTEHVTDTQAAAYKKLAAGLSHNEQKERIIHGNNQRKLI